MTQALEFFAFLVGGAISVAAAFFVVGFLFDLFIFICDEITHP